MTREQTIALALLINRGACNALDVPGEGNTPQGLAQAALQFALACGWATATDAAAMRRALNAHGSCRADLQAARSRVDALELALATVLGAARAEPPHIENLIVALAHAGNVLADGS